MLRRALLWTVLIVFLVADSSQAARGIARRRGRFQRCCDRSPACYPCEPAGDPCYCLQRLYFDYFGDYDLYECTTYPNGCEDPSSAYDDLYYGPIINSDPEDLPETCVDNDCETDAKCARRYLTRHELPEHGEKSLTKEAAWNMVEAGLSGAEFNTSVMERKYYMIPLDKSGVGRPVYMIVVQIPPSKETRGFRYLGVETGELSELDDATFLDEAVPGRGAQLKIKYKVDDETRTADVWLQKPEPK